MVLGWLLLLGMALPSGTAGTKNCMFCELTDSLSCPGIPMNCGNDEDCFTGQGTAPGLSTVTNKGCMQSSSCGREEPVTYQGVTYSLISTCCYGNLCNGARVPTGGRLAGTPAGLVLGVMLLRGL